MAAAEEVASVIFEAATDETDQFRYIPTEDIKPLVVARRETSEAEEVKFMREQFNTSGVVTGEIS